MLRSITLLGSSSGRNAGDAALISGIADSIDSACGRRLLYEIPTYRPDFVWHSYQNRVRPITMLPWHGSAGMLGYPTYASIMRTDMSLIFDNMLFDRDLWNPLFNFMSSVALMLPRAKRQGKWLGFYNIGAGPVTTPTGREMLRKLSELADFITVREQDSYHLLREIGVKNENMIITADAALSVRPASDERGKEILAEIGLENEPNILAININKYLNSWAEEANKALSSEEFLNIYAKAITRAADQLGVPLLFVCTQHHDIELTTKLMNAVTSKVKKVLISNVTYSHYELKALFKHVSLLFAMRLHAAILCSSSLTPIISLAFQKKVSSYYDALGLSDCAMSFKDFTEDALVEHILRGWEQRGLIRQTLETKIPALVKEADKAAQIVSLLDKGKSPEEAIALVQCS